MRHVQQTNKTPPCLIIISNGESWHCLPFGRGRERLERECTTVQRRRLRRSTQDALISVQARCGRAAAAGVLTRANPGIRARDISMGTHCSTELIHCALLTRHEWRNSCKTFPNAPSLRHELPRSWGGLGAADCTRVLEYQPARTRRTFFIILYTDEPQNHN